MASDRRRIHLVPHFHYDPVWIEDQRTYTRWAFDLVLQYLQACRQDNAYHLMLSEIDYLKPFLGAFSDERQFVKDLIAAGRIYCGGSYSEPNEMSIQGEGIIRNIIYGRAYHGRVLGANPRLYLPLDVFGHCLQLPQIAAKAGFEAIVWSKDIVGAPALCRALAPDGTAVLQKHEHYWYTAANEEELIRTVGQGFEAQAALGLTDDLRLMGPDMAPPQQWLTGRSGALAALDPQVVLSTPGKYLDAVAEQVLLRRASIPLVGRDFSWYHMGTAVSRAELKTANRLCENRLLAAEKWATLASLVGAQYPDPALDKAWRQVLFGQHHDAITGTPSDIPFLDLMAGYREALELAAEVEENALSYIVGQIDTARERGAARATASLVVFNPMAWPRTDVCCTRVSLTGALAAGFEVADDRGRTVPAQILAESKASEEPWADIAFIARDVPSIGYRTYFLRPAARRPEMPSPTCVEEAQIENARFTVRAEAAQGPGLTSLYDKRAKRELINGSVGLAFEVMALSERPDREMSPWEVFTTGGIVRAGGRRARLTVTEGPVFSLLRLKGQLPDRCDLKQDVILYRDLDRIELRTTIERYRGLHELLTIAFPLALRGSVPTFEDRFCALVRKASCGRLDFRTLNEHNISGCGLGAAQNWVDVGPAPSLAITERGKAVAAVPLGPCAIVTSSDLNARAALGRLEQALLRRGVTCTPWLDTDDPEADSGACAFRISLGASNAYSRSVLESVPGARDRLAQAIAEGDWGGVLIRRPDPKGQWPEVPVLVADTSDDRGIPWLVQMLALAIDEDRLAIPRDCDFSGSSVPRAEAGVALLNRGSLAASLENDGTLVGLLFHTAAWSTHPWGEGRLERYFVPEHKSHVFEHALLPHAGDWREGGVVRAGYEYNNPLRARQGAIGGGALPARFSLLEVDAPNVVVTALKPLGNPLADLSSLHRSDPEAGVLVRLYETEGRAAAMRLQFGPPPLEAWLTDLVERKTGEVAVTPPGWRRPPAVSVDVPACGIVTVAVRLPRLEAGGPSAELGPVAEPYRPIHCRYWDHNSGAAPMGNQPLTLWLRGELPVGQTTRFSLGLTHDGLAQEITGSVEVRGRPDWQLIPTRVPYRIPPGSQAVYEVMIRVPADTTPGFLRAVTEAYGQQIQDVLPVGEIAPLELSLERTGAGFTLSVRNPNPDYVEGQAFLITPLESWGRVVDGAARAEVSPRMQAFRLNAGEAGEFRFSANGDLEGLWAVGKVAWYGQVQYVQERT